MDKRYVPKQLSQPTKPVSTKTVLSNNNSSNLRGKPTATNSINITNTTSKLDTGPLDDAMRELLDICKQYNDKLTAPNNLNKSGDTMGSVFDQQDSSLAKINTNNKCNSRLVKTTKCDNERISCTNSPQIDTSSSIENLQQKQCEIQAQLDEVLQVSKKLASKQRKKLDCIFEDLDYRNKTSDSGNDEDGGDEEDELVEFQQIENELRISELNRQLNNIQEEIRLRLFKRLLSNTHPIASPKFDQVHRNDVKVGYHTEQTSPSSSSCSNEPSVSTTTSGNLNQQGLKVDIVDGLGLDKIKTSHSNTFRNNSANSDLERIEEDEEYSQDYYNNSDHFRSVYEEKISPIYNLENSVANRGFVAPRYANLKVSNHQNQSAATAHDVYSSEQLSKQENQHITCSIEKQNENIRSYSEGEKISFRNIYGNADKVNINVPKAACSNNADACSRPLTLYLPKPDEEIDLVEHIQALGHDLDIISSDLSLDSSSAQGYLWKSCSNNNKKWLRRYFYFDRNSKLLLYYDSKSQQTKKQSSPNNMIHFDEISDVYVDHKLSGIGEKARSSKRKNYVFVLATIHRKYLLASSRAEVMRAWIDVLFTAARANDYFQNLSDLEDETNDEILVCI